MDCAWLLEDDGVDSPDSESDPEGTRSELEDRLYAIVHHNDLSQPLAPDLAKHFSVQCDDGDVVVTLKNDLEDIKSEECSKVDLILEKTEPINDNVETEGKKTLNEDNEVVIISENDNVEGKKYQRKRFRYSDVNIDTLNETQISEDVQSTTADINYFNLDQNIFTGKKFNRFKHLNLPKSLEGSDWKLDANSTFISIGNKTETHPNSDIIDKITEALKQVNPKERKKKLRVFATHLFKRARKGMKRKAKRLRLKNLKNGICSEADTTLNLSPKLKDTNDSQTVRQTPKLLKKERAKLKMKHLQTNGSISLNITPFKPDIIDLASEDERNSSFGLSFSVPSVSCFPTKWSKEMIKFYSRPAKKEMMVDMDKIIANMKRTTIAEDWKLDPRDCEGTYRRPPSKAPPSHRCVNCRERGHYVKECPKPKKIVTCTLCGQYYHMDFSCPNKICMKCGVFLTNNSVSGECEACYYATFDYDVACKSCGNMTHRTVNCPDAWRSFHATTEGEKKIPEKVIENKRKYCCNCARQGHFSDKCPFPLYSGQQLSCLVTNYSACATQVGTTEIVLPDLYADIVNHPEADTFLQNLSDSTNASIECDQMERNFVFRISGTFDQCKKVKTEIETYVNTRKRKRNEPCIRRKKYRLGY